MDTNEPKSSNPTADEEWLRQRWAPWCPERERQGYLDDLKAQLQQSGQENVPTEEGSGENICRSSLQALDEALAEENERMRAAYRRAGL